MPAPSAVLGDHRRFLVAPSGVAGHWEAIGMTTPKDLTEHVLAPFNVVAVYPDMEAARKAVDALERAGVEAGNISLLGKRVEEAAGNVDTRNRDDRMVKHVG